MVSKVNIKAWIPAMNKLNPDQAIIGISEPKKPKTLDVPRLTIKPVKIAPANMFPNKRKPSVNVFANSSMIFIGNKNHIGVKYVLK